MSDLNCYTFGFEQRRIMVYGYQIVVTENTEYHLQGRRCVGVRDRETKRWDMRHDLLGHYIRAVLNWPSGRYELIQKPVLGGSLWFVVAGIDFVTSRIKKVLNPTREDTENYLPPTSLSFVTTPLPAFA